MLIVFIGITGPDVVCIMYISSWLACLGGGWCWYSAAIPGPYILCKFLEALSSLEPYFWRTSMYSRMRFDIWNAWKLKCRRLWFLTSITRSPINQIKDNKVRYYCSKGTWLVVTIILLCFLSLPVIKSMWFNEGV